MLHYPRGKLREVAARSIPQWEGSDGEVKRTSAIMVENQEDEEELEGNGWDEEEVHGDEIFGVVVEEVRQVCEGGLQCRTMYLATVA